MNVTVSRKINIGSNETRSLELGLQVLLDADENAEAVFYSVKNSLEGQLDAWEHETRTNNSVEQEITVPEVTAPPPLITASTMKPKQKPMPNNEKTIQPKNSVEHTRIVEEQQKNTAIDSFTCPVCGENMTQKDGKDYYLCTKHWAYPDMIKKGMVKDRKF